MDVDQPEHDGKVIVKQLQGREVAEGIGPAYALEKIAKERGIYLPIAMEVYEILEGKEPLQSLKDLLTR